MDVDRPYCHAGVWTAPLSTGFLCETCRNRIPHRRGGSTCGDDRLKLTVARACRGYEGWTSPDDKAVHVEFWLACDDLVGGLSA